jgi:hypothetical protein
MPHEDDKVGYKNPPRHARFKPGQSGNKKGRPRGRANLKADLADMLRGRIPVTENGRRKLITRQEYLLRQLFAEAAKGDTVCLKYLLNLSSGLRPSEIESPSLDQETLQAEDKAIIEYYLSNRGTP